MSSHELKLYGAEHCHLCDEAEAVLREIGVEAGYVDIVGNDELVKKYGIRIPVLQRVDTGAELGWPFDAMQVLSFLKRAEQR